MSMFNKKNLLWGIGVCILFPLFFQLNGGVYKDINPMIDSQGIMLKLPIPISIFTCLICVSFLARGISRITPALLYTLGVMLVGLLSLWLAADGVTSHQRKLVMIVQVLLPMSGLFLGLLIDDSGNIIAKAFLVVLSFVVPAQLLATWAQGGLILTHYLYAFSIYSHFQYVTLIFVCAFAFSLTSLWNQHNIWLCFLSLLMTVYAVSSLSFLTIFAYFSVAFTFLLFRFLASKQSVAISGLVLILILITSLGTLAYFKQMDGQRASVEGKTGSFQGKFKALAAGEIPLNVQERFDDWALFGRAIFESKKTFLIGHSQPMPREIKSSPHNLYVDLTYTFGLIGLLPILSLIGYTVYLCMRNARSISSETWWLLTIVSYLVLVDSNFKVTLRQPYPGIFTYFLWGLLLTRLRFLLSGKSIS